jgi:hypothetical protein
MADMLNLPSKRDIRIIAEAGRFPYPTSILYQRDPVFTHVSNLFDERAISGTAVLKRQAFESWMLHNGQDWIRVVDTVSDDEWTILWLNHAFKTIDSFELVHLVQRERRRWLSTVELDVVQEEFPMISGIRWTHRGDLSWATGLSLNCESTVDDRLHLQTVFGAFMPMYTDVANGVPLMAIPNKDSLFAPNEVQEAIKRWIVVDSDLDEENESESESEQNEVDGMETIDDPSIRAESSGGCHVM